MPPPMDGSRQTGRVPLGGDDRMNKTTKIIAGAALVIVVVAVLALALGGSDDDYDYGAQAKQEIDKYGYDAVIGPIEVEKGTNIFGAYIIKVSGTFVSDGVEHTFQMTTSGEHDLQILRIDDRTFIGDEMGNAEYDYTISYIGPFQYTGSGGYTYTESPEDGNKFVLVRMTVKNVGHSDGLSVSVPDLVASDGNKYDYDWTPTYHYEDSYSGLSGVKVSVGNTVSYNVIYQIPEGLEAESVSWEDLYLELYGYVHVPGLADDA